jgi:hypothetical protein
VKRSTRELVLPAALIVASGLDRPVPGYENPEAYLSNKAERVAFTNRGFDAVDATVSGWSSDDLREETNLFGQEMVQRGSLPVWLTSTQCGRLVRTCGSRVARPRALTWFQAATKPARADWASP